MTMTRAELKALWVGNYAPSETDFDDVWDAFFNLADDGSPTLTSVKLDTTPAGVTPLTGEVYYDATNQTLAVGLEDGTGVVLQIGQEMMTRVVNKTGVEITNGQVVYVNGAQGNRPTVALAQSNTTTTARLIGYATHDIADNAEGYITTQGEVRDLNTTAFSVGDTLYLSSTVPGGYQNTAPEAPNTIIMIGTVTVDHATQGKIQARVGDPTVPFQGAYVASTGVQSIPDDTATVLAFDGEIYATFGIHDNVTNNTRLTVPTGVTRVRLLGQAALASVPATDGPTLELRKNGAIFAPRIIGQGVGGASAQLVSGTVAVVAGDYMELAFYQKSGGAINTDETKTWFAMEVVE